MYRVGAGSVGIAATGVNRLTVSSTGLAGVGTNLTALNATNLASGTVASARLPAATTSVQGAVILNVNVDSTSAVQAATASAVKTTYDLANAALPKSGGTTTGNITMNATLTGASITATSFNYPNIINSISNSSTTLPASANSVKQAYDHANAATSTANSANTTANSANTTANAANTTANAANNTANSATTTANNALPKAGGTVTGTLTANGNLFANGGITTNNFVMTGFFYNSDLIPNTDGVRYLGTGSYRYNAVYASSGVIQTSDSSKKHCNPLLYGLSDIIKIETVQYKWKTQDAMADDDPEKHYEYYGVLADQVDTIFPELVYNQISPFQLNYSELIPICINAIKELKSTIDSQNIKIRQLQTDIATLMSN
jgi:hypothetical protein